MKPALCFLLITIHFGSFAQFKISQIKSELWIPENYVIAQSKQDTTAYLWLKPVEAIENPFRLGNMMLYGCAANVFKVKEVMHKGTIKYQLNGIKENCNTLDSTQIKTVAMYGTSSFYISKEGEKLLLEILNKNGKQAIWMIKEFEGYEFTSLEATKKYLFSLKK